MGCCCYYISGGSGEIGGFCCFYIIFLRGRSAFVFCFVRFHYIFFWGGGFKLCCCFLYLFFFCNLTSTIFQSFTKTHVVVRIYIHVYTNNCIYKSLRGVTE